MASLHRREKSPFWFCSFQSPDGRWVKKSTKLEATEKNRETAMDLCLEWSKASKAARTRTLVTAQARKVLNELLAASGDDPLDSYSINSWFAEWLQDAESTKAEATRERYRQVTRDFLKSLGDRAKLPLRALSSGDVRKFRDGLVKKGLTHGSVNLSHKIIAGVLSPATKRGLIPSNPAAAVTPLPTYKEKVRREPFTKAEVEKLLRKAPADWKGAILCSFFLGLRLGDVATLRWGSIDLAACKLTFTPKKTERLGKTLVLPIPPQLQRFLLTHPMGRAVDFCFPSLAKRRVSGRSGLSRTFRKIMEEAGVAAGVGRERKGSGGHTTTLRSFHSLRHTAASYTGQKTSKAASALLGHSGEAITERYLHAAFEELEEAVNSIPELEGVGV